ncbi:MAG: acetyl-CoA carboxylase biotin carboxyl carrier protein subunit [Pelagibacterales bacterium]|nr:acetyl-CoA carboxylase biotin carboxyl carrier protein subunit [Pelagibacterales bacterium]PPR17175.1 MAG: Biotin carboxyl carrier protein of acetyl-CoA carboxylase [Alphaproteobacteria bacterium MarineAlpha9_Bin3]|tara:strand:+ start:3637 stop:4092 length:456 start_codon:yes stop_codon:yes gene_type:complete
MGKISIDKSLIKDLSDLINENNLSEITVTQGRNSVKVARNIISSGPIVSHSNIVQSDDDINNKVIKETNLDHPGTVKSPMVGTIYLASSPEAKPFITVGQSVKEGDQLFIIEAMKTMNPVKSPFAGTVKEIIVKNEMSVEFDEALVIIDIS